MKVTVFTVLTLAVGFLLISCGKSDVDLQKAVIERLATDKITGVTVVVKDGVATLSGETADAAVKYRAESSAKVEGIKSINNDIKLKPESKPTDPTLKNNLDEALRKADCKGATVEIGEDGKVTITGIVPEAKYGECFLVVYQAGITNIDNQLKKSK